jgi:hypothetical protein
MQTSFKIYYLWCFQVTLVLLLLIANLVFRWQNIDYHSRGAPFPFLRIEHSQYPKGQEVLSIVTEAAVADFVILYLLLGRLKIFR